MSDSTKLNQESNLRRRDFFSVGLLSALTFLPIGKTFAAQDKNPDERAIYSSPADEMVDSLEYLLDIEMSILSSYYILVGAISNKISSKYGELKKATNEFLQLVPELRSNNDVSHINNLPDIKKLSAIYIGGLSVSVNNMLMESNSNMTKLALNGLENTAKSLKSQQESITLSPEAVEKLRYILKLIKDLDEPTSRLNKVSVALAKVSKELRLKVAEVKPLISDAI